ncbi:hypothetical protein DFJ73DRAFT_770616 [Zopfochytrium polystomum]|nr:hypothetical protein DFJ73DRAFT_770616 [Zopfochytrium polystomum]
MSAAAGHDANEVCDFLSSSSGVREILDILSKQLDAINSTFSSIASTVVSKIDLLQLQSTVGTKASTIPTNIATNSTTLFAIEDSNFHLEGMPAAALNCLPKINLKYCTFDVLTVERKERKTVGGEKGSQSTLLSTAAGIRGMTLQWIRLPRWTLISRVKEQMARKVMTLQTVQEAAVRGSSWGEQRKKKKAPRLEVFSEAAISSTESTVATAA